MKLILAQGNPGTQYKNTRHNIGFMILDTFAAAHSAQFVTKSKFHADIAELQQHGEKVLLVKPQTFYNETGTTARALLNFYKLPSSDLIVIHDELSLPFGTIKTRFSGRDAGNNGIKSLNTHIGEQYARIRVGIYNTSRDHLDDTDFVLGKFTSDETLDLSKLTDTASHFIDSFINNTFSATRSTLR